MTNRVLIVDFGSQVTQLIARRVRESGVYSEIHPFNKVDKAFLAAYAPRAVILSGGPASVTAAATPRADDAIFALGVPVLGICYGQQTMCAQLGGNGRARRSPGIRSRLCGGGRGMRLVHGRVDQGRARTGVDESWRPCDRLAARIQGGGHLGRRALCRHRRRDPEILRRSIPPRSGAYPARRPNC